MSDILVIPGPLAVRALFEDLLGGEVIVDPGPPMDRADLPTAVLALFTHTDPELCAVVGMQLDLAAHVGAALGRLRPGAAQETIEARKLTAELAENVFALCIALTGLVNAGAPHAKLYQVVYPGMPIPDDAVAHVIAPGHHLDLTVEVPSYGKGKFSLTFAQ